MHHPIQTIVPRARPGTLGEGESAAVVAVGISSLIGLVLFGFMIYGIVVYLQRH